MRNDIVHQVRGTPYELHCHLMNHAGQASSITSQISLSEDEKRSAQSTSTRQCKSAVTNFNVKFERP